jgi:hypothetical protein
VKKELWHVYDNDFCMLSEDGLAIEPFLLIESLAERKFGVLDGLLVPDAISFAEDGLPESFVVIDHLIVDKRRQLGLG